MSDRCAQLAQCLFFDLVSCLNLGDFIEGGERLRRAENKIKVSCGIVEVVNYASGHATTIARFQFGRISALEGIL